MGWVQSPLGCTVLQHAQHPRLPGALGCTNPGVQSPSLSTAPWGAAGPLHLRVQQALTTAPAPHLILGCRAPPNTFTRHCLAMARCPEASPMGAAGLRVMLPSSPIGVHGGGARAAPDTPPLDGGGAGGHSRVLGCSGMGTPKTAFFFFKLVFKGFSFLGVLGGGHGVLPAPPFPPAPLFSPAQSTKPPAVCKAQSSARMQHQGHPPPKKVGYRGGPRAVPPPDWSPARDGKCWSMQKHFGGPQQPPNITGSPPIFRAAPAPPASRAAPPLSNRAACASPPPPPPHPSV